MPGPSSPDFGTILYTSDANLMCQVFPEGEKRSQLYVCVISEKQIYLMDNVQTERIPGVPKLTEQARDIPFGDVERVIYPSEDVKIMLWMKRKGNRTVRIYRKSTGKYFDLCIGRPQDAQKVYEIIVGIMEKH